MGATMTAADHSGAITIDKWRRTPPTLEAHSYAVVSGPGEAVRGYPGKLGVIYLHRLEGEHGRGAGWRFELWGFGDALALEWERAAGRDLATPAGARHPGIFRTVREARAAATAAAVSRWLGGAR